MYCFLLSSNASLKAKLFVSHFKIHQMKNIFLFTLCSFLLFSCSSTEKEQPSEVDQRLSDIKVVAPTKEKKQEIDLSNYTLTQPEPEEAGPNATVYAADVRVLTPKNGGKNKIVKVGGGGKGQDYSKLPDYDKNLSPSKVTEACLINLAGGRTSEARKFTTKSIADKMRLNGGDGGPIIKNLKITSIEEKINGKKATVKFSDNMDTGGTFTLTRIGNAWVITGIDD